MNKMIHIIGGGTFSSKSSGSCCTTIRTTARKLERLFEEAIYRGGGQFDELLLHLTKMAELARKVINLGIEYSRISGVRVD